MPDRSLQKPAELLGGPGLGLVFRDRTESGSVGDGGNVAGQQTSLDRSGECAADEMDLEDRLEGERLCSFLVGRSFES